MPQPRCHENQAQRQQAYRQRSATARQQQLAARALPPLPALPAMPGHRRWRALFQLAHWALHAAGDEMQAYYDDRSETWQESDNAEALLEQIALVEQALEPLEELMPSPRPKEVTAVPAC